MFLGADLDSASPSPQPMPPSLAPLGSGTGVSSSGGGYGVSLSSNNPLFGTGGSSSSSLLSASNAAGAGGAVRRGALSGSRSPPTMLGASGNRSSNGSIGRMSSAEVGCGGAFSRKRMPYSLDHMLITPGCVGGGL